jgi:hypothetical protein
MSTRSAMVVIGAVALFALAALVFMLWVLRTSILTNRSDGDGITVHTRRGDQASPA